jgi:HlyD family secretion protein
MARAVHQQYPMDISRPDLKKRRLRRTATWITGALILVAIGAFFILRLKPAIPEVDSAVWTDTVKRGPLLRQVRGPGSLVPREDKIRLIPAQTEATVVRIRVLPGAQVQPDTILMDLVDPELHQHPGQA